MTRRVGLSIARAIDAFGRERYGDTVAMLLPVRYRAHAFGGSHAQRDVVHRTLLEAAFRSGQAALARALSIVRAIAAFGRERFGDVVALLLPVRYQAHAFGGSHAQRDVVHRTLLEAAFRSGQHALARALAIERTSLKPHCPFSWNLRRKAEAAAGA
jgi:nucleotidyltransferase/DNA polymerase involved in DNA repair